MSYFFVVTFKICQNEEEKPCTLSHIVRTIFNVSIPWLEEWRDFKCDCSSIVGVFTKDILISEREYAKLQAQELEVKLAKLQPTKK